MLVGCEHCGMVVRRNAGGEGADCPECGRPQRQVDDFEARVLARERRIAAQFQRTDRLQQVRDARRRLEFG
jgi:hypothetical protein